MAKIWNLPVLYACVNNGYAISTPVAEAHASGDIVDMVVGYGITTRQVDGNDIEAAYQAVAEAVAQIRRGDGPVFLEFKTWRWQGIFSGEFRPALEVRHWREERDPIELAGARLLDSGEVSVEDLQTIETEEKEIIENWIAFALDSPMPDPAKAVADVYVGWEVEAR
jgi:pyruvate dehydrogenase E1 component alpha subunit